MFHKSSVKYKIFIHAITYIIVICFLCQNYIWAQGAIPRAIDNNAQTELARDLPIVIHDELSLIDINKITIPENIGNIQDKYLGSNGKLIIHIQDSHANYEAQKNNIKMLESLTQTQLNGGKKIIAIEGASGSLSVSHLRACPDNRIKEDVSEYFLKNGNLNAAEYFTITGSNDFELFGIEDKAVYEENLSVFRKVQDIKTIYRNYILQVNSKLEGLIEVVFGADLSVLESASLKYKKSSLDYTEYLKILNGFANKAKISASKYLNVAAVLECIKIEDSIEMDIVEKYFKIEEKYFTFNS